MDVDKVKEIMIDIDHWTITQRMYFPEQRAKMTLGIDYILSTSVGEAETPLKQNFHIHRPL